MPNVDVVAFLSLIVALSAYIATIRLRVFDRIRELRNEMEDDMHMTQQKESRSKLRINSLKGFAKALTLVDAPLVVSAVLLFFHGFWNMTLGLYITSGLPTWLLPASIYCFMFSGVLMVVYHICAWKKSFCG